MGVAVSSALRFFVAGASSSDSSSDELSSSAESDALSELESDDPLSVDSLSEDV